MAARQKALLLLCTLIAIPGGAEIQRLQEGALVLEGIPELDAEAGQTLAPFLEVRSARFLGWMSNGSMLIRTRFGATTQLHSVSAPLGTRRQLTFFAEPVRQAVTAPAGSAAAAFLKDQGGDENYQVHLLNGSGAPGAVVTDGSSRYGQPLFSPSGERLAFMGNARDGIHWDIYLKELDSADTEVRRLTTTDGGYWYPLDFSGDEQRLLVQQYLSINESRLYLLDIASGQLAPVDLGANPVGIADAQFRRDAEGLLVIADVGSEHTELYRLSEDGARRESISAHRPWNVDRMAQTDDGSRLAFVTNEDGISRLTVLDTEQNMELDVPALPVGIIDHIAFQPGGHRLGLSLQGPTIPGDVYVLDSDPRPGWVRWTASELAGLEPSRLAEPELIRYPSFDGRDIPAFVYLPEGPGPHPVLVHIHGGPEGQFRPRFRFDIQYYVSALGMAVVAPNVRGSAGYGKSYLLLDNGMRRMDSVKDIGALLTWLTTRDDLNEAQTAVMGGSYGGFMVLASLAEYGDRLLGGIDTVGISNFVSFLENTSPYRQDLRRAEYGDERDPAMREFLEKISPTNNADSISKPLLVVQGANDPRVPRSESEQMVSRIRAQGGSVWYLLATDEGHGIRKKKNQRVYYQTAATFLKTLIAPSE